MWIRYLLLWVAVQASAAIRVPAGLSPFRGERAREILQHRGVDTAFLSHADAWRLLTDRQRNTIFEQESQLIRVRYEISQIMQRPRSVEYFRAPPKRVAEKLDRILRTLHPRPTPVMGQVMAGLAHSADRLFMRDILMEQKHSLQERLDLLAEAVSVSVQTVLHAHARGLADEEINQNLAETLRLVMEAHFVVAVGDVSRLFQSSVTTAIVAAVGSLIAWSLDFRSRGWSTVGAISLINFWVPYAIAGTPPIFDPGFVRSTLNTWFLRRTLTQNFWPVVASKLYQAAAEKPVAAELMRFLENWYPRTPERFVQVLQQATGADMAVHCQQLLKRYEPKSPADSP